MGEILLFTLQLLGAIILAGVAVVLLYVLGCLVIIGWKKLREVWKE